MSDSVRSAGGSATRIGGRWQHRAVLLAVLLIAGGLRLWDISGNGFGNIYYAAAVRSMSQNWHNFFYASFDPGGFVAVDKPPVALWLQVLSVKLLGYSGLALHLPQILAGLGTILLVYWLVRHVAGPWAGVVAALVLAVMPVNLAVERSNLLDSTLVFLLVAATAALLRGIERGRLGWLILSAILIGVGFNTKMLAAYLVLPAFCVVYWLGIGVRWRRRVGQLVVAGLIMAVVSTSWPLAVDLTPTNQRPYAGGSQTNSVMELAFGYNGLARVLHFMHGPGRGPGPGPGGRPGPGARPGLGGRPARIGRPGPRADLGPDDNRFPPEPLDDELLDPDLWLDDDDLGPDGLFTDDLFDPYLEPDNDDLGAAGFPGPRGRQGGPPGGFGGPGGGLGPPGAPGLPGGPGGPGSAGGITGFGGTPGWSRLANRELAGHFAWLFPLVAIGWLAAACDRRPRLPLNPLQRQLLLWGLWLVTGSTLFSLSSGIMHNYYLCLIAPPLGALAGIGTVHLARRAAVGRVWILLLILAVAGTAAWQVYLLQQYESWRGWLVPIVLAGGALATLGIMAGLSWSRPGRRLHWEAGCLALGGGSPSGLPDGVVIDARAGTRGPNGARGGSTTARPARRSGCGCGRERSAGRGQPGELPPSDTQR